MRKGTFEFSYAYFISETSKVVVTVKANRIYQIGWGFNLLYDNRVSTLGEVETYFNFIQQKSSTSKVVKCLLAFNNSVGV